MSVALFFKASTQSTLRDDLLRDHPWNWATKRVTIPASTVSPTWGFANAFPLPANYRRLMEVQNPSKLEYRIESTSDGKVIVTDISAPLNIAYAADPQVLFTVAVTATANITQVVGAVEFLCEATYVDGD